VVEFSPLWVFASGLVVEQKSPGLETPHPPLGTPTEQPVQVSHHFGMCTKQGFATSAPLKTSINLFQSQSIMAENLASY
jgi:hypothetical protein